MRAKYSVPTFRVLHRLTVILSLRRIRDPSARGDEVRILRLRSQARFAQDDMALRERGRPGPGLAGVAKREASYGPKSGPNAGSRASSPGEQAAACDYIKTRALGYVRYWPKNSCAGPERAVRCVTRARAPGDAGGRAWIVRKAARP